MITAIIIQPFPVWNNHQTEDNVLHGFSGYLQNKSMNVFD